MQVDLEGLRARLTVGDYQVTGGFGMKCILDDTNGSNWAKIAMSEELLAFLQEKSTETCSVELGNEQGYELLIAGSGRLTDENTLFIYADEKAKSKEQISVFFLDATLQEAVRYILALYGITEFQLTEQEYSRKQNYKIDAGSYVEALRQVNAVYGVDVDFYMQDGTMYYGIQQTQDLYYVLTDDQILDMEQTGNVWRAEIIPLPGLHERSLLQVDCEEYTGLAYIKKCVVDSDEADIDMWIEFEERKDG